MWTCDIMFIWAIVCFLILLLFLSFCIQHFHFIVKLWKGAVFITLHENTELKWFGQAQTALSSVWVQPMLHAGWNMFHQHLHCIVYTSRLISWVTMALCMNPRSFLSSVSKHLAIASVSCNVKVCEAGGSMSMYCCTLAFTSLKV